MGTGKHIGSRCNDWHGVFLRLSQIRWRMYLDWRGDSVFRKSDVFEHYGMEVRFFKLEISQIGRNNAFMIGMIFSVDL